MIVFNRNDWEWDSKDSKLVNAEVRYGYNFGFKNKNFFTPFLGVTYIRYYCNFPDYEWVSLGFNQWERIERARKSSGMLFGTAGIYYDHSFSSIFDLGLKLKGLIGGKVSYKKQGLNAPISGIDFAIPITFRFGPNRHWDFRLEPFILNLWGSSGGFERFIGLRNTIGYRF